MNIVLS